MKKAIKDLFLYFIAGGLSRLFPILILPYIAQKLTQTEFGVFSLFQLYLSLISVLILLGVDQAIFRKIPAIKDDKQKNEIIGAVLYFILCLSVLLTILFLLFDTQFNQWMFEGNLFHPMWIVIGFSMITSVDVILTTKLKAEKRTIFYFNLMLIRSLSFLALIIILLELGLKLDAYFIALFISEIIMLLFISKDIKDGIKAGFSVKLFKQLVYYGLPLSGVGFVLLLIYQFDHYLIKELFGVEMTGNYAFAYKFSAIIGTIILIANNVWQQRLFEKGEELAISYMKEYAGLMIVICIGSLLFIISVFNLFSQVLIPDGFIKILLLIQILGIGFTFYGHSQILDSLILQRNNTFILFIFNLMVLIINIVLNMIFLPLYGLIAAAVISALSYFLLWLFVIIYLKVHCRQLKLISMTIEFTICITPLVINLIFDTLFISWLLFLLVCILLVYKNRKIISQIKTIYAFD
ncbi:MAG: oligosaccharide flippase family protein [Calditrichaceae bacterium]|nr:oligosaccharide flippase family protein [Calditrichaceae bacterium]MBN2708734.1 oligosaccharide flippase family protein [Calditrichaceae bacterium]RQV97101.1 MAG: hypothetical protein EH224_02345 [Calditrichota bacterium]